MQTYRTILVVFGLLTASAGQAVRPDIVPVSIEGERATLVGTWQSRGAGWLLDIRGDGYRLYDITSVHCAANPDGEERLEILYDRVAFVAPDQIRLFEPFKDTYEQFDRIPALPERCRVAQVDTPQSNFDVFAATFAEQYPFFEAQGIDWAARVRSARPLVRQDMSDAELLALLGGMLEGLHDGHVRISADVEGDENIVAPFAGPTLALTDPADAALRDRDPDLPRWLSRYRRRVLDELLQGSGVEYGNGLIVSGRLGPDRDIGYVNVIAFDELADAPGWDAQVEAIDTAMDAIVADFAETRAAIVDLTNNRGGVSAAALAMASHFADRRRTVAAMQRPAGEASDRQPVVIAPATRTYTRPVYVITSDVTVSAGELATMAMRAFPHVTHVGARTRGAMSKILPKYLPNGWWLWLSSQAVYDADGELWEGRGMPPQIDIPIFDPLDPDRGHLEAVARVVDLIE